jgi:hypothetical protein
MFQRNVGPVDQIIRLLAGMALIILGAVGSGWWLLLGIALIISAAFAYCPLYRLGGISTRR